MADYAVTGKKGSGKSLYCVGLIRDALREGRRVATNLDVRPEMFGRPQCKTTFIRLPDRPCIEDLEAIGRGQEGVTEDDNGYIILDETSTFFNSRSFGDKTRQPMLDWLVHSRKYGWDVYYICQGLPQIDKQLRESMIEYHVSVKRTDKWPIPVITPLTAALGFRIGFPKLHVGICRHGVAHDAIMLGRKWYRGKDIYPAYDTQQVFLDRSHPAAVGIHSVLSAYQIKGRYMSWWERTKPALYGSAIAGFAAGIAAGIISYHVLTKKTEVRDEFVTAESTRVIGSIFDSGKYWLIFNDGTRHLFEKKQNKDGLDYYLIEKKWYASK